MCSIDVKTSIYAVFMAKKRNLQHKNCLYFKATCTRLPNSHIIANDCCWNKCKFAILCCVLQDDRDVTTDPAIVAFRHSGDFSSLSANRSVSPRSSKSSHVRSPSKPVAMTGQNVNASNNVNSYMQRETGVIEKLLVLHTLWVQKNLFAKWIKYSFAAFLYCKGR